MYEKFVKHLSVKLDKDVQTGRFGKHMNVALVNDGPVTIWIDTKNKE
jgi:D-tyrosyl-tRNA(Tyr) deacylase